MIIPFQKLFWEEVAIFGDIFSARVLPGLGSVANSL